MMSSLERHGDIARDHNSLNSRIKGKDLLYDPSQKND